MWCAFGPAHAANRTDPAVASFDCMKAQSTYEVTVCGDYGLAAADRQMSGAYRQALMLTPESVKKERIVHEQRVWLASIASNLKEQVARNTSSDNIKKSIESSLRARISALSNIKYEMEKVSMLDSQLLNTTVCHNLLEKDNLAWEGDPDTGMITYSLSSPPDFPSSSEWNAIGFVQHAKFDFTNIGKTEDVYSVSWTTSHFEFHYFIVATPEEKASVEKLLRMSSWQDLMEIPEQFTYATPNTGTRKTPKYKSIIFDTSSSPVYGWGWYTRTKVIQQSGVTYLISSSVNNIEGPTLTIFKPHGSKLTPICYYKISSTRK